MRGPFTTTLGQIVTLVAASAITTFILLFVIHLLPIAPGGQPPSWPWPAAYRIVALANSLAAAPESERPAVLQYAAQPQMSDHLVQDPVVCGVSTRETQELQRALKTQFHGQFQNVTVRSCNPDEPQASIQTLVGLPGETLEVRTSVVGAPPFIMLTYPLIATVLFLSVGVITMSVWAIYRVISPLRRLSAKAEAFGHAIAIAPIDEEGPLEIRRMAQTFNLMQERITRSIRDRTRMLAAISHDLRTPLTRMRLQLETNQSELTRSKLLRDIGLMQSMVTSSLAFLSGSLETEDRELFDLGALLSTLCDEYEETGASVSYEGPAQIRFFCRPNAITRALTNLIENALHFGENVTVGATVQKDSIVIDVADDGPGIPADRVQDVMQPFVRLNPSNTDRPGSVGLGLAIVKDIVEAHEGTLELLDRQPTGLIARIRFSFSSGEDRSAK